MSDRDQTRIVLRYREELFRALLAKARGDGRQVTIACLAADMCEAAITGKLNRCALGDDRGGKTKV